jgi:hypothetical protein
MAYKRTMSIGELIIELQKLNPAKMIWQTLDHYSGGIRQIKETDDGEYLLKEFANWESGCMYECENCEHKSECDDKINSL